MAQRFEKRPLGFKTRIPIIQAPMAGSGINTPELVAAVCNGGGLGCIAGAYLTKDLIAAQIRRVRELTDLPFAANLFAPSCWGPFSGNTQAQIQFLKPIHERLGLEPPHLPEHAGDDFGEQLDVLLSYRVPVVSFTFGILPSDAIERLRLQGTYVIGTATTVAEAKLLESAGVDAVVAQGGDGGGHRGTFDAAAPACVGTIALVPQIADAVRIPVIASGGIMDGRGVVAALVLGASAVQMGTAFLVCAESGAAEAYKQAVLSATENSTSLTSIFSGRWARGIRNRFMEESERSHVEPLSFPWQNALTGPMRKAATKKGDAQYFSLWAGQGTRMARRMSVAELMSALEREIAEAKAPLASGLSKTTAP
jgi:nitronate monooxygenase